MVLKTLESSLDCKEIKPVIPKGNQPLIFIGRTEAETMILRPPDVKSHLLENSLILGKIEGKRRRGCQRMGWLGTFFFPETHTKQMYQIVGFLVKG